MLKYLRQWLLGGASDKREAAWLMFIIINAILIFAVHKESLGFGMPQTWSFMTVAWPFSAAVVAGVHAQHFHAQSKIVHNDVHVEGGDDYDGSPN